MHLDSNSYVGLSRVYNFDRKLNDYLLNRKLLIESGKLELIAIKSFCFT